MDNVLSNETVDEVTQTENTTEVDHLAEVLKSTTVTDLLQRSEFAKEIQSITDRRVTQALATAREKWNAEMTENLDEAKRLEKMTADQRAKYEFEKEKKSFEEQKKAFEREQLEIATGKELMHRGLDVSFASYLTGKTAEETTANIDTFEKRFNEAVASAIATKMQGRVPKEVTEGKGLTLESIKLMSEEEINANWNEVQKVLSQK